MNSIALRTPCAALILALSALTPALAQNRLPAVEVESTRNTPLRYDVSSACPNMGEQLQDSLARSVRYIDQTSEMRVEFDLHGQALDQVSAMGGPMELRAPVRRAVRWLQCANGSASKQRYAFLVIFKPDDGTGEGTNRQAQAVTIQPLQLLARKD
ncbi:MAG: hypothetical protein K2W93_04770 [Burkholderiaceae bacterium]|nr:hypothetical protein [Burkholderiaceae bacterium]